MFEQLLNQFICNQGNTFSNNPVLSAMASNMLGGANGMNQGFPKSQTTSQGRSFAQYSVNNTYSTDSHLTLLPCIAYGDLFSFANNKSEEIYLPVGYIYAISYTLTSTLDTTCSSFTILPCINSMTITTATSTAVSSDASKTITASGTFFVETRDFTEPLKLRFAYSTNDTSSNSVMGLITIQLLGKSMN